MVQDLTEIVCSRVEDVQDLIKFGLSNRKIGCTNLNIRSSRSHTIFRIMIESRERDERSIKPMNDTQSSNSQNTSSQEEEEVPVLISTINLIDLAGSESASAHNVGSGSFVRKGSAVHEMSYINKVLL